LDSHVRNVGYLLIGLGGGLGILALAILTLTGGYDGLLLLNDPFIKRRDIGSIPLDRLVAAILISFSLLMGVPLVVAGWGILAWKRWARTMSMLLSAIFILHVPIGTVAGIYSLWVLQDETTEFLFDHPPVQRR
jgi:hypothetical protein